MLFLKEKAHLILLLLAIFYYVLVFSLISCLNQANFATSAYDVGLYDQGIWLMSRFMPPFTTIKGVMLFGDHAAFYSVLFVPFYWFWPNINVLYIAQSLFLALASLPLFLYAKERLRSASPALIIALAFLLSPALQNMNLENFHPESMTVFFLMSSLYFLLIKKFRFYYPALFLTVLGKEDVGLTVFFLGLFLLFFNHEKKHGILTSFLGLGWYFFASRIIMPAMLGYSAFTSGPVVYSYWFKDLSENVLNPFFWLGRFFSRQALSYYFQLLGPVLFLNLLNTRLTFALLTPLAINVLSGSEYLSSINFHYNYLTLAFVYFGLVEGLTWLKTKKINLTMAVSLVFLISLFFNYFYSHIPLPRHFSWIKQAVVERQNTTNLARNEALALIPDKALVSASYSLVPHLTHRQQIFMFPNPYRAVLWNMWFKEGEELPPVGPEIDYIVLDLTKHNDPEEIMIIDYLKFSSRNKKIFARQNIIVMKKNDQAAATNQGLRYSLFNSEGKLTKKGDLSLLYFPESRHYFRNLMGEEIKVTGPAELEIAGYFFVPESGLYLPRLKEKKQASLLINQRPVTGQVFLSQGFNHLVVKYSSKQPPYSLRFTLVPPDGQEYIIPDQHWRRQFDAMEFKDYAQQQQKIDFAQKKAWNNSPNLIFNGDFEKSRQNYPVGWELQKWESELSINTYGTDNKFAHSGDRSLKLQHNKAADSRFIQTILVEPNTKYRLTGWIRTEQVLKEGRGAYLQVNDVGPKSKLVYGTTSWQKISLNFETGPKENIIQVLCRLGDYGLINQGIAHFDNLVLKKEPTLPAPPGSSDR